MTDKKIDDLTYEEWTLLGQGLLRDYFAAAALRGMLASGHQEAIEKLSILGEGSASKGIALAAYGFADAMIKARKS